MKVKKPPSYCEMLDEVVGKFSEYSEENADPYGYLLSLLYQERETNYYLKQKIEYLERKIHECL